MKKVLVLSAILLCCTAAASCEQKRSEFIDRNWTQFAASHAIFEAGSGVALAASMMALPVPVYEVDLSFNAFAFEKRIVISHEASKAPLHELMFVLAHELGHIHHRHIEDGLAELDNCEFLFVRLPAERRQKHEYEADLFAASYLRERGLLDPVAVRASLMRQEDGGMDSSHPVANERISRLEKYGLL